MAKLEAGTSGLESENVVKDADQFNSWYDRTVAEKERERKNWKTYDATFHGQWDPDVLQILAQEGRPPSQYNFTKSKIDTIVGTILLDQLELDYTTEMGDKTDTAIVFDLLYAEDRGLGEMTSNYLQMLRAGFIYRGWMKLEVDHTKDPRGRLRWRYMPGYHFTVDPDWESNKIDEAREIFVSSWMSAKQILAKYPKQADNIKLQLKNSEQERRSGSSNVISERDRLFDASPRYFDERNGLYLVVDKYELVTVQKKMIYDRATGQFLPTQPDAEQEALLIESLELEEPGRYDTIGHSQKESHVWTFIPGISTKQYFQKGKTDVQVGGYPFVKFSSDEINGKPNTWVDQLKDPQQEYNKRMSTATHILMTTSNNHLLMDDDLFENDDEFEKMALTRNRPGSYSKVAAGSLDKVRYLEKNQPPNNFLDAATVVKAASDSLTPAVPALQAVDEGSGQSGVLLQTKISQAQVAMQITNVLVKALWEEIGRKYFMAGKQNYIYPMVISGPENGEPIVLNVPGGFDMTQADRLKVTVTQSPASVTYRNQLLQTYMAIQQTLPPGPTKSALALYVLQSLPNIPENRLKLIAAAGRLEAELARLTAEAQIAQLGASSAPQGAPQGVLPPPEVGGQLPQGQPVDEISTSPLVA